MSKSKDPTENTLPLSSDESIEGKVPPSEPSASSENTPISTVTSKTPSAGMLSSAQPASTTLTTVAITEKARQHAMLIKIALKVLLNAGLIKRFEVRSPDSTTVLRIRYEFDLALWTEELDLK